MKRLVVLSLAVLFVGCAPEPTEEVAEPETEETTEVEEPTESAEPAEEVNPELTILAEELESPWSIEKVGDVFYLTERAGTIAKIENNEVTRQAVNLEQELSSEAEAGLLGFVLDPAFAETQQAFAYYTYNGNDGPTNRIVRLELADDQWTEVAILLDDVPSGAVHHGGRLAIGLDEKLYATTGDATIPELSQDVDALAGKILRINLDGSIPEDNPFPDSPIYSYGHRNAQGLAWTADGTMYASEHGSQANDEINEIEARVNYGWPMIEGEEETDNMSAPLFTSGSSETWAPSGTAAANNKLYVAALRGEAILLFDLSSGEMKPILSDYGRIRDVYIADEFLYFITNNTDGRGTPGEMDDRLIRIGLSEIE